MRWLSSASSDAELRTKSIFRLKLTDKEQSRGKREREEIQGRAYGLDTCTVHGSSTPGIWFSINGKRFGGDTHILEERHYISCCSTCARTCDQSSPSLAQQ
ncbi:unnamed protein product [Musa acuminata subsp. burmannicoides]